MRYALPPEFAGRSDDYIDAYIEDMLPAVQREGLADAVDALCENIAFSSEQVGRVFDAAQEALAGATIDAARALGLAAELGSIEVGKSADLALWEISSPAELAYCISGQPPEAVARAGAMRSRI